MHINIRRFIALTFIVTFIIGAPLLILYTSGYRYSFKKQKFNTAGSLVLETEPKNAFVEITELDDNFTTPIRINDLLENEYHIKISKDNYFTWEKTLKVNSMETTFAEDIILFKDEEPTNLISKNFSNPKLISDNSGISYIEKNAFYNNFHLFDFETEKSTAIFKMEKFLNIINTEWSQNNNYCLISQNNTQTDKNVYTVLSRNFPENFITVNKFFNTDNLILRWSTNNDNIIYIKEQNTIYKGIINGQNFTVEEFYEFPTSEKVTDFIVHGNEIFYLQDNHHFWLKKTSISKDTNIEFNKIALESTTFEIKEILSDKIVIKDVFKDETYFINLDLDNVLMKKRNILEYAFNQNKNHLLIWDKSEIQIIDFNKSPYTYKTIVRVSKGIKNALWINNNYLAYTLNGEIKIIELDDRHNRIIWTTKVNNASNLYISPDTKIIYWFNNDLSELNTLTIQ